MSYRYKIIKLLMEVKIFVFLVALLGFSAVFLGQQEHHPRTEFYEWQKKYSIHYSNGFQLAYRQKVFYRNLESIKKHNLDQGQTYQMGVNQFTALTRKQFMETYLTLDLPVSIQQKKVHQDYILTETNWIDRGAVTPVKDQGQCASGWAFSATGGLQGLHKLVYGELVSFSESNLMDCSTYYGNQGCDYGYTNNAYEFVAEHGINSQKDYPYVPFQQDCQIKSGSFTFSDYEEITYCTGLANAITARPVSVSVDASNWAAYKSGVFNNCKTKLNHGATLVASRDGYWVVKNSWGVTWGDKGYITLQKGNTCGVCDFASYPDR